MEKNKATAKQITYIASLIEESGANLNGEWVNLVQTHITGSAGFGDIAKAGWSRWISRKAPTADRREMSALIDALISNK